MMQAGTTLISEGRMCSVGSRTSSAPPIEVLMLAEQSHRTANDLNCVTSLLHLVTSRPLTAAAHLDEVSQRIEAAAAVQRLLTPPLGHNAVDAGNLIEDVCNELSTFRLEPSGISMEVGVDECIVPARTAWAMAAIVSELVTNAARHAFQGRPGLIVITLRVIEGRIVLRVGDDGVGSTRRQSSPVSETNESATRGSDILDALARSLGADFGRVPTARGVAVELSLAVYPSIGFVKVSSAPIGVQPSALRQGL